MNFHGMLAGLWLGAAVWLAVAAAVASGGKTALERRRGLDHRELRELAAQHARLQAEIDWLASAPMLESAVARLQLKLAPPGRMASR